jgi:hypothetical protein
MQSNETNGLISPFEYVPRDLYHDKANTSSHNRDPSPDESFYQLHPVSPRPDIVLQTEDSVMAPPAKRRTNVNGTAVKPSAASSSSSTSTAAAAGRPSNRSLSGPAVPQASLTTVRSAPALATASRARNGLIKERLKQFDVSPEANTGEGASRYDRSRTPSGSNPTPKSFHSPEARLAKNSNAPSPRRKAGSSTPGRQPLFGEVLNVTASPDDPGYGIPRAEEEEPPGLMHRPHAMFARSRSHSDLETSPVLNAQREEMESTQHQRSQSDVSAPSESRSTTASPTSGRGSPASQALSPASRIPIRSRRTSDIASSKAPPRQRAITESSPAASSTLSSMQHQLPHNASATPPMTLSSRRYSPPKKLFEHGQSLTAVIKPPLPKTSPPLRSTRTRQPVTNASTNASRSKVADRFKPSPSEVATGPSRPKPSIPGQVNIIERRARLQKNLQGGSEQAKPVRQDLQVLQTEKSATRLNAVRTTLEMQTTASQSLTLDTANVQNRKSQGDPIETDFEESPTLGHDVQETLPNVAHVSESLGRVELQARPAEENGQPHSLLKHVMSIRASSPSAVSATARTQLPDDFLSEIDDGETIQITLGETPKLFQNDWQHADPPDGSPEAFHTPREESQVSPRDEYEGSDVDVFDGRSSIYPDDSVSVVFQRRYADQIMASQPPPPLPVNAAQLVARHDFTLDSDARSQINRVLDQYQEGHVTPEMAHGFQKHVESLTPQLSRHAAWDSPEATKHYLQNLLDPEPNRSSTSSISMSADVRHSAIQAPLDDESEASGGIAIIYEPSHTHSRPASHSMERHQSQHSHTASNSTLRPPRDDDSAINRKSYLDDVVFPPAPPPKDSIIQPDATSGWLTESPSSIQLPQISTGAADGLGLSIDRADAESPPRSPLPPSHPPPPPPIPRQESSMEPTGHVGQNEMPLSPNVFSKKTPAEMFAIGLPESPTPRGRARRGDAVDSAYAPSKTSLEITPELQRSSSSGAAIAGGPEKRDKDKELTERKHRIKELVDTEHSFHQDMTILMDIYMATSAAVLDDDDRRTLFGNLEQVRNLSTDFLDALKQAASSVYVIPRENRWNYKRGSMGTSNSGNTDNSSSTAGASLEDRVTNDRETTVGQAFAENLARIEKVYGDWLKNHTAANKRLIELQKLPAVKFWLEECHDNAKDITAAWSLDSLIIKPAQRLLKYPLLLTDLLKYTSTDHPDYPAIKQALEQIKDAAGRINDLKRRAELVEEAMSKRRESDSKMKVGKLLNRRTEKLKQQVGLSNLAEDQEYESVAQKFGGHFFQLQVVMRDVEKYLEDSQLYIDAFNAYISAIIQNIQTDGQERYPEKESNWLRFATTLQEIGDVALPLHVKDVRRTVIDPIQQLWRLHVGPQKMMAKRKKRLVEYVRHKTQVEKGEKPDKKLEQDAELFKAVNETLKEELPKLYALTKKLVETCLANFVELQATWQNIWQRKLEPFVIDNKEFLLELDFPEFFDEVLRSFKGDMDEVEDTINLFRICNGSTLAEAQAFLSPSTTFTKDDDSSFRRPSTISSSKRAYSLTSDHASHNIANTRHSDNMGLSPLVGSFGMPDGLYQPPNSRGRAGSALSSRGPSTPHSFSPYPGPSAYPPLRPTTSSERSGELSPGVPRLSLDRSSPRLEPDSQYLLADHSMPGAYTPDERYSGIFHSALPMSDSPRASSPELGDGEAKVLFLAASLFEFHIDSTRKEAGYPYLTYQPGEVSIRFFRATSRTISNLSQIFDVIGQKGELWLAKNQDDYSRTIGWIWEKHFARILPEN